MRRLFVAMVEMTVTVETAHEAAIAGQSEALNATVYAEAARPLETAARSLAALAEAAAVIVGPSDGDPSGRPDQTP